MQEWLDFLSEEGDLLMEHSFVYKRILLDERDELMVFVDARCHSSVDLYIKSLTTVKVTYQNKTIRAPLKHVKSGILGRNEIGLSPSAEEYLGISNGSFLILSFAEPFPSIELMKEKIKGQRLREEDYNEIINDITGGKYSIDLLNVFLAACKENAMDVEEILGLTRAILNSGYKFNFNDGIITSFENIGARSSNAVKIAVTSIVASLKIPISTISFPTVHLAADLEDVMSVFTNVKVGKDKIGNILKNEFGFIASGKELLICKGIDPLIRSNNSNNRLTTDILLAIHLARKLASGASHCVFEIPFGISESIKSIDEAIPFALKLKEVAEFLDLTAEVVFSDGSKNSGFGFGPSLEGRDLLYVLQNNVNSSAPLVNKIIRLATEIVSSAINVNVEVARNLVVGQLESYKAHSTFIKICEAQGVFRQPEVGRFQESIEATKGGTIQSIDFSKIILMAKIAGAPLSITAGIDLKVSISEIISPRQVLCIIHSNTRRQLENVLRYYENHFGEIFKIVNP